MGLRKGHIVQTGRRVARKAKGMWRVVFLPPKEVGATGPARRGGVANSSSGRATACEAVGSGFDPRFTYQNAKTGPVVCKNSLMPRPSGNEATERAASLIGVGVEDFGGVEPLVARKANGRQNAE